MAVIKPVFKFKAVDTKDSDKIFVTSDALGVVTLTINEGCSKKLVVLGQEEARRLAYLILDATAEEVREEWGYSL